jgi:hypothetical protein
MVSGTSNTSQVSNGPQLSRNVINRAPAELTDPSESASAESSSMIPMDMTESLFLSKAFAQSMQPNRIIPFFYKATGNFDQDDIIITTLITGNRFNIFG